MKKRKTQYTQDTQLNHMTPHNKPNVIFILVDDLGWAEPGCYGHPLNETPNIDEFALSGVRFTQAYASSTVCSPSRAGLLTGQVPPRNGITDYLRADSDWYLPLNKDGGDFADNELPNDTDFHLNPNFTTMASMFKKCGYSTGIIGKWHLSGYDQNGVKYGPEKYGFDEVHLSEQTDIGGGSYFHPYVKVNSSIKPVLGDNEYLVDRLNLEAVEYIKRHKEEPFFLYLSHYAVHTRLEAKEEDIEYFSEKRENLHKGNDKNQENCSRITRGLRKLFHKKQSKNKIKENNPVLAAMLKSIDDGVGEIQKTLRDLNLDKNTMIVFTSDNGGEHRVTNNYPLRAGKSHTYEGGLRVSQIISYPGIAQPNSIIQTPTINLDFYPTFAEIIGFPIPKDHIIDGVSILPILKGEDQSSRADKRVFSWHYPLKKPHFLGGRSSAANRKGPYKYIWFFDKGTDELYNLDSDESESLNLVREHSDLVVEHKNLLRNWITEVGGKIPKGQKNIE